MIFFLLSFVFDNEYSFYTFTTGGNRNYVNNFQLRLTESNRNGFVSLGSYNGIKGIKRFYVSIDSTDFSSKVVFGDIGNVRGLKIEGLYMPTSPSITIGRERDRVYHFIPNYNINRIFFSVEGEHRIFPYRFYFRLDSVLYSPSSYNLLFSTTKRFKRGNFASTYAIGVGFYGYPGAFISTEATYKREKFILFGRGRYITNNYVDESNRYFERGRVDIYSNLGYRFPFGLGIKYGISMNGETYGRPLLKRFMNTLFYSYKRVWNFSLHGMISFRDIDSLMWERGFEVSYSRFRYALDLRYLKYKRGIVGENIDITGKLVPFYNSFVYLTLGKRDYLQRGYIMLGGVNLPLRPDLRMNVNFMSNSGFNISGRFVYRPFQPVGFLLSMNADFPYRGLNMGFQFNSRMDMEKVGFAVIYGVVFSDENMNGMFEKGEETVKNVKVVLDGDRVVSVGRDGIYRFFFVKGGKHILKLKMGKLPAYMGTKKSEIEVEVKGYGLKRVDIPLMGLGSVSGYVFRDGNRNGIKDKGERGIPNVLVGISGIGLYTVTDQEGFFFIGNVPPGMYIVKLKNIPPGFELSIKNLIIYAAIRPRSHMSIDIGLSRIKKPIKIKRF